MKSGGHQVSYNARWAIAQTIISAGVLFVLYRFLLSELGAEKLGLWSLILASTSLARLGELGFSSATLRFVGQYVGAGQQQDAAEILETALLSISLPFMLLAVIAIPLIGGALHWFIPAQHMSDALVIVPWAMLALWLGVTGGIVQSAIDGCGRMDLRNIVLIVTNLLYLGLAVLLTPMFGLKGIAIAQAIQAGATLLFVWWLARSQLTLLPWIPWRWRKHRFGEIFNFAISMQIGSVAGMLIDPLTKALVSRFGGLQFLAYYEMANQVVTRARGVLIAGFQALLPTYAATNPDNFEELWKLDQSSQVRIITFGVPYLSILASAFPLIAIIWTGEEQTVLVNCGFLVSLTWLVATAGIPSYFFAIGTGRGWIVAENQLLMLLLTIIVGFTLGHWFSGYGVVIGTLLAFLVATAYMKRRVSIIFQKVFNANTFSDRACGLRRTVYSLCALALCTEAAIYLNSSSVPVYAFAFGTVSIALGVMAYRADNSFAETEVPIK